MLKYQAKYYKKPDEGYNVTFFDLSDETLYIGSSDLEFAAEVGEDMLPRLLQSYIKKNKPIPVPSDQLHAEHNATVGLTFGNTLKVLIWNEMLRKGLKMGGLAKKMGPTVLYEQVERMFDLSVMTGVAMFSRAIEAMESDITISIK